MTLSHFNIHKCGEQLSDVLERRDHIMPVQTVEDEPKLRELVEAVKWDNDRGGSGL